MVEDSDGTQDRQRGLSQTTSTRSTLQAEGRKILGTITSAADNRELTIVTAIREGMPERELPTCANEAEIDLLIISPHRRTGLDRFLRGSGSERIRRQTERPVLTIKKGQ